MRSALSRSFERPRPFNGIAGVLALVVEWAKKLDVRDVVGPVAHERHDVINVVSVGEFVRAPMGGALAILGDFQGFDFGERVASFGAFLAGATAALVHPHDGSVRLGVGRHFGVKLVTVGGAMRCAARANLFRVGRRICLDVRDHFIAVALVGFGLDRGVLGWIGKASLRCAVAVAGEALLSIRHTLVEVAVHAGHAGPVARKVSSPRLSPRHDEVIAQIVRQCHSFALLKARDTLGVASASLAHVIAIADQALAICRIPFGYMAALAGNAWTVSLQAQSPRFLARRGNVDIVGISHLEQFLCFVGQARRCAANTSPGRIMYARCISEMQLNVRRRFTRAGDSARAVLALITRANVHEHSSTFRFGVERFECLLTA